MIKIGRPGILTTVQDLGRTMYLSQAVPTAGAMDLLAGRLANIAVGNAEELAVIEFTYADASFTTETDVLIAYAGSGAALKANENILPANSPLFIPAGTKIQLTNNPKGCRTYLAVAGGWQVPTVLGSKSTYLTANFGGFEGRILKTGDMLQHNPDLTWLNIKINESLKGNVINFPKWSISTTSFLPQTKSIRVVPAQEFTWLEGSSIIDFLTKPFTLSTQSNRMGYHLTGATIERTEKKELLSTAVTFGTIQVTGEGKLIILMADGQTTGGYPRIAQVVAVDLPLCAQLKPNDQIYFKEISRTEAETLYLEREQQLKELTTAIALKFL